MEKERFASYKHVVRQSIVFEDLEWSFHVPNLPKPRLLNDNLFVKSIVLASERGNSQISIKLEKLNPNRATQGLKACDLILLSFAAFRPRHVIPSETGDLKPWTARECTAYIARLLRTGVQLQGVHYNFYGHSNSQLKSRTCYLLAASKEDIAKRVESLGDFSKMKTVAKKTKRIGLLFSTARAAVNVDPSRCEDIPDVEMDDYVFTDGCGLISPRFAQELSRRLRLAYRDKRYSPSVFQIRYRGYKGVVTLDPRMKDTSTFLQLRKSMKKFVGGDDLSFSVVDYAKPYVYGNLNDEVVILLHSLGVFRQTLLQKQHKHFEFLAQAAEDPRTAFRFLCYVNKPELAEKLLMQSLDSVRPEIAKLVKAEYGKMLNKRDEQKCRILIPNSRLLFGVCDAWGVLKEGECHVKVTMDEDGQPRALKGMQVLVTRNPCLHPGDLQKFHVVERPELSHLVDCIVFPTRGRRPSADMMSGGDLDGDTSKTIIVFVCWDRDLMPSTLSQPALYPAGKEPVSFKAITDDDRLQFFAGYSSASLGRVKNLYLEWVRVKGPMASECQELNRLFSQCVDGNRIEVPRRLEVVPKPKNDGTPFILDELHERAKETITADKIQRDGLEGYDFGATELLCSRDNIAISEFEIIKLVFRWCRKNDAELQDFLHFFDLNVLTAEEKAWTLSQLPASSGVPSLVLNALCSSSLVSEGELRRFDLHHSNIHWKRVFDSSQDRMATFLEEAAKSLELFHRKLIVLRVDERLTLGIYVPKKIARSQECLVDDRVRLFAFPHSQGSETQSRLCLPTKVNYRLYSDESTFQLFESQRSNTWVHIRRGGSDDSTYRNMLNRGDRRRRRQETVDTGQNFDFIVSVALDKFSRGLQRHIGRVNRNGVLDAEIYVITNRDLKSMETLDLWLDYVDTEERMPLISDEPREYSIPSLRSLDLTGEPENITRIARKDVSVFDNISSPNELTQLLSWLYEKSEMDLLCESVEYLLNHIIEDKLTKVVPEDVLEVVFSTLHAAPLISLCFTRVGSWDQFPEDLATYIRNRGLRILRGLILRANEAQDLVLGPLKHVLSELESMSMNAFADLVELVALTIRTPDLALDILLECFEPPSTRLLSGASPVMVGRFVHNLFGIALDHIGEVADQQRDREGLVDLKLHDLEEDGSAVVEAAFRIDAPGGNLDTSAHVRFVTASPPSNAALRRPCFVDALVTYSEKGLARFSCCHPLPPYFDRCSWKLTYCGPFVTAKTMFTAVRRLALEADDCCLISDQLLEMTGPDPDPNPAAWGAPIAYQPQAGLNESQNAALEASMNQPLVCLWGPPGTGKTQTIAAVITALEQNLVDQRILVTAPTHNAVDNVMRRYLSKAKHSKEQVIRVSTEVGDTFKNCRLLLYELRPHVMSLYVKITYNTTPGMAKPVGTVHNAIVVYQYVLSLDYSNFRNY
ncbi:RNA dependent RNA polymerase-domain-containing protein [Hypoxylon sp. NC1633]|nr:RNA dependent RNA polymerase-domain-containing protein [Hypoxylon sp. NC1633]